MKKLIVTGLALAFSSSLAHAAPITLQAVLTGAAENPPNASPGFGFTTVIIDPDANTLRVIVAFGDLVAPTTAAHIHCCTLPPANAGVASGVPSFVGFPLGVTAGGMDQTYDTSLAATFNPAFVTANGGTPAGAEAALLAGLLAGQAYLNIHSSTFPGGEIRGFLQVVPEPATFGLIGIGLAAVWAARRRKR